MKIEKHYERVNEIENEGLRREYLRIAMTLEMAEKHFDAFKRECDEWLNNIYRDGVKKEEGEQEEN